MQRDRSIESSQAAGDTEMNLLSLPAAETSTEHTVDLSTGEAPLEASAMPFTSRLREKLADSGLQTGVSMTPVAEAEMEVEAVTAARGARRRISKTRIRTGKVRKPLTILDRIMNWLARLLKSLDNGLFGFMRQSQRKQATRSKTGKEKEQPGNSLSTGRK